MHPVFIIALFTIAKTWKQPKCLLRDEWLKKMWCIYTVEYYSVIKRNKIMPFVATWIQLEIIIPSYVSQNEKDKYYIYAVTYMWNLNYDINGPIDKTEARMYRTDKWLPR